MSDHKPLVDWKTLHGDRFESVRVLITGAAGFIGSHLVEALVELGAEVVAYDDLSAGRWENLKGFDRSVEKITASILDQKAMTEAAEGCEYLFHQAALGSVPKSLVEPVRFTDVNVRGTACVLEAARSRKVKRLLFASSSSVYGNPPDEKPRAENEAVQPLSPYAATKAAGEQLLRAWSESYGLDAVSLRYFNVFGPRQNADSDYAAVIAAFGKAMAAGRVGTIYGDGEQARDFTYVANVVHGNLLAAACNRGLGGQV
ncbi:MAG: NAD-dependent epimerase/dehydratase family protein, partial [Phycisphaeraceae bacterium]|nr:NAD-dependent epimerase/dehydratase family protein [Phycisphaeraceae bacterium]